MTPIRSQYLKIKGAHPDAILLFRMGDFYETFDDDAVLAAKELEITLTSRRMMQFPMLLGRACVRKRFLVDPSHSFLSSKQDLIP